MKERSILTAFVFMFCANLAVAQVAYPFKLPAKVNATINIETTKKEKFNNLLLGFNIHKFRYSDEQTFVEAFSPITVRFPHGLFSNWHDWKADKARVFGKRSWFPKQANGKPTFNARKPDKLSNIDDKNTKNLLVGIDGLKALNDKRSKKFDMCWTFNMSADGKNFSNGSPTTIARYNDLKKKGFEVKAVELGNECFYPGQRSEIIPNVEEYLKRAKSMSKALKAKDKNIQLSVPMLRRASSFNPNWNKDLAADQSFYDAVTVHSYVGNDPDGNGDGNDSVAGGLTARKELKSHITDFARKVTQKPIWLTEWGVRTLGGFNGVSALGMADCYMMLSENQKDYKRANWFSVNGSLNSFVKLSTATGKKPIIRMTTPKKPEKPKPYYVLTSYGITYSILRDFYENSTLLGAVVTSPNLVTGVKGVSSRAVIKGGKTYVMAINMTNKTANFKIKLNSKDYTGSFNHEAFGWKTLDEKREWNSTRKILQKVKTGSGAIALAKFSINVIELTSGVVTPPSIPTTSTGIEGSWFKVKNKFTNRYLDGNDFVLTSSETQSGYDKQFRFVKKGNYYNIDIRKEIGSGTGILRAINDDNKKVIVTNFASKFDHDKQFTVTKVSKDTYTIKSRARNGYMQDNSGVITVTTNNSTNRTKWILKATGSTSAKSAAISEDVIEDASSVVIYPNPTSSSFNISLRGIDKADIVITDLLGKLVYSKTAGKGEIQIGIDHRFNSGIYLVRITGENGTIFNKKLVVE